MFGHKSKLLYATIFCTSALVSGGAFAQTTTVPSTADPGVIGRDLESDRRPLSRLEDTIRVEDEDTQVEGVSEEKVFTLKGITLEGSSVYNQNDVNAVAAEYIGQPVSFADLNRIAQKISRQYRTDGYLFSRANLPPQEIENGIVQLQAIEGRVTEVEIVGDYKDANGLIQAFAAKLRSEGPANTKKLERYLLLIDDLPGIRARSLLQPADTQGGAKLVLSIEQDMVEGAVGIDNRGSRFLGQTRGTGVLAVNSLLGIHDRTTLRGIMTKDTEELRFFDLTHEEQIGTEGLRLKGRIAVTDTEPGWTLKPLDVEGVSHIFELDALYPLIRGRQYNLNLIGGFTALNSKSDILNIEVAEDHVRYFRAGGEFDFTDSWSGVNSIDLSLAKGIGAFNATRDGLGRSRANGEHHFLRTNLSLTRIQDLPGDFSVQFSGDAQYSNDPLLASEEFTVGGGPFGRAYDAGEIAGDRGMSGAIEVRYGGPTSNEFIQSYQVYGLYDVGKVWNINPVVAESKSDSIASAGVGVRFNLKYDLSGYVEVNKPLTSRVGAEGDDDPRIFFNLLKRF